MPLAESPLPGVFESGVLEGVELAVVLEPTDCILHPRVPRGTLQARVDFHGERAHSARPWTGQNANDLLDQGLAPVGALEPLDVELDGLVYREVLSVVRVEGGIAQNVVPAIASAELNFRFAPGRSRDEAEARLRELVPAGELHVLHNSPAALPGLANPHVARLREACPRRRAKAGVDAGRAVRGTGDRRDQLRPRRDGLRAQSRRADPDRKPPHGPATYDTHGAGASPPA